MPALLTHTSMRPYAVTAASTRRCRSATLLTSASTLIASEPSWVISSSTVLGVLWPRHVVHDDLGALPTGDLADRGADAAVSSGDDNDFVLEQHAQFSSWAGVGAVGGGGGAWSRPSGEQMRWATSAVHPVWCEAPSPRPVSPWKYSLNVGCSVHNGPAPWSRGWLGGGPSGPGRKSETRRRCSSSATSARLARWPEPRGSSTVSASPRPSACRRRALTISRLTGSQTGPRQLELPPKSPVVDSPGS